VCRALLPGLLELHGGLSSNWSRKYVQLFVSMGGPYIGTSRAARLSVAGNGMVMEQFFSNYEAAAIVRSLSSVPSLYAVAHAHRAVLAVGSVCPQEYARPEATEPNITAADKKLLETELLPWYHHNDMAAGGCSVSTDLVLQELGRMISACHVVSEEEKRWAVELSAEAMETLREALVHGSGVSLTPLRTTLQRLGLSPRSRPFGDGSTDILAYARSRRLACVSELETILKQDVAHDSSATHTLTAQTSRRTRSLPRKTQKELVSSLVDKFGKLAVQCRMTKITLIVNEILRQQDAQAHCSALPYDLPIFLVRDHSVMRISVSEIWLHRSCTDLLAAPRETPFAVVQLVCHPVATAERDSSELRRVVRSGGASVHVFSPVAGDLRAHRSRPPVSPAQFASVSSGLAIEVATDLNCSFHCARTQYFAARHRMVHKLVDLMQHCLVHALECKWILSEGVATSLLSREDTLLACAAWVVAHLEQRFDQQTNDPFALVGELPRSTANHFAQFFAFAASLRPGSFLDRVAQHVYAFHLLGNECLALPVESRLQRTSWQQATDATRATFRAMALVAARVFEDDHPACSDTLPNAAAYHRIHNFGLEISVWTFATKSAADAFESEGSKAKGAVQIGSAYTSLGQVMTLNRPQTLFDLVASTRRTQRRARRPHKGVNTTHDEPFGINLCDGWFVCQHDARIAPVPASTHTDNPMADAPTHVLELAQSVPSAVNQSISSFQAICRRFLSQSSDLHKPGSEASRTLPLSPGSRGSVGEDHGPGFTGKLGLKLGSVATTTPPSSVCCVHVRVQWRRHAFHRPRFSTVDSVFDFGASCAGNTSPDAETQFAVPKKDNRLDQHVSARVLRSAFGPHNVISAAAALSDVAEKEDAAETRHLVSPKGVLSGAGNWFQKKWSKLGKQIADTFAGEKKSPHPAKASHNPGVYIGVPPSKIFSFESGDSQQLRYFADYKADPLLFDEALKCRGICITAPPACDNVLNLYGTGLQTERHALYKRRDFICTTDGENAINLEPDDEAAMADFLTHKGIAYETSSTEQLQIDTGRKVRNSGDGTVPYTSLRWPSTWNRSSTWRQQRRVLINHHLRGTSFCDGSDNEVGCHVGTVEIPGLEHRGMLKTPNLNVSLSYILSAQTEVMRVQARWLSSREFTACVYIFTCCRCVWARSEKLGRCSTSATPH